MRRRLSIFLFLLIFVVIPSAIWLSVEPVALRLASKAMIWRSLGQISGLLGMSLMGWGIFLSARWRFLDRWLLGTNRLYRDHHWLGVVAFLLLLFHPLALAVKFSFSSLSVASLLFIPWSGTKGVTWGILALAGLMLLLILTFFISLAYHKWHLTHRFLALVFIFSFVHMLLVDSDILNFSSLRLYYLLLSLLAFLSIGYRLLLSLRLLPRYRYRVVSIAQPQEKIFDLWLEPLGRRMNYRPGQFAFLTFNNQKFAGEAHPFSLAGQRADGSIRVIIKNLGDYTDNLKNLEISDQVLIEGPYGFFGQDTQPAQLWISGGIGFTPFLSLLDSLTDRHDIFFYHVPGVNEEVGLIVPELEKAAGSYKFHYQIWSKDQGHITAAEIIKAVPDWQRRNVLICGPSSMMSSLKKQFSTLGGKKRQLISEDFNLFV